MTLIRDFELPDELYYWVEKHIWVQPAAAGLHRIGMTAVAYHLLRNSLEAITVKPSALQAEVLRGKNVAMVESVKYIGGVPAPFTGTVARANEILVADPNVAERDPYGAGWIVEMRAAEPAAALAGLLTGAAAMAAYQKLIEQQNIL